MMHGQKNIKLPSCTSNAKVKASYSSTAHLS